MQDTPKGKKKKYKMSKRTARLIWLSIVFASIVSIFSGFSLLEQGYKTPGVLLILFLPGILVLGFAFYRSGSGERYELASMDDYYGTVTGWYWQKWSGKRKKKK